MRVRSARFGLGLIIAGLAFATTVPLASAAGQTSYTATFPQEKTIQRTCPRGAPPMAFCFTGTDHSGTGTSTPGRWLSARSRRARLFPAAPFTLSARSWAARGRVAR